MTDSLGDRMKSQYEDRTRYMLPRRTWTIIRLDGKAFSSFTRHCEKPFDAFLHAALVHGAIRIVSGAQGAKIAYVQSDEISLVLTDFDRVETEAWFDGNVQKIASVASSLMTGGFNEAYSDRSDGRIATFDARVFTIPDPTEVTNYMIWRQKDAIRNSISCLAQSHFSPKALHGADQTRMLTMLSGVGVEWSTRPIHTQRGTVIRRVKEFVGTAERSKWVADFSAPVFTEDRAYLNAILCSTNAEMEAGA